MLLLHLMSQLFPGKIRAIHINHQLQSVSDDWALFVRQQCRQLNVPCMVQSVHVAGGNLENQAREARYQAYRQHLNPDEILVLAHHQQDQAETVMLRLLTGSGVRGLSAMQAVDARDWLMIWRPLLDISREQIAQWTQQLRLDYVDDPTNMDTHYDRAWCRQELWPVLQHRYPGMQQALARSSYLMQDADEILNDVLKQDLAACGHAGQLQLEKLSQLSTARQRQLLSAWMQGEHRYRPPFDMVQRLQHEVIHSRVDAQAALHWNGFYYVRFQQVLYRLDKAVYEAERSMQQVPDQQVKFLLDQSIRLDSGLFQIERMRMGLSVALLGEKLNLKHRAGGEKIHLYGRTGSRPLKKIIQDAHIFPWMRHTIQILSMDNVMLGVFTPEGFWLAQSRYCEAGGWQPDLIDG